MKKTILNTVLALSMVAAGISGLKLSVKAETIPRGWTVTYTGVDEFQQPVFTSSYNKDCKMIDEAMPGDIIEYTITYVNATDEAADFYMNANVLYSIEDINTGGTYRIFNNGKDICSNDTFGIDAASLVGVNKDGDDNSLYFSLGTVNQKSKSTHSGEVKVLIELTDDSKVKSYGNLYGFQGMVFNAQPVSSKQIVKTLDNGTEIVSINDASLPLAASTKGGSLLPSAICSIMFVVGMCIVFWSVAGNINKKRGEI